MSRASLANPLTTGRVFLGGEGEMDSGGTEKLLIGTVKEREFVASSEELDVL